MKPIYHFLIFLVILFNSNDLFSQVTPCSLSGASVYLDYSSTPAMMNASVNGMSMYDYNWNNGISAVNQTSIYSGWCVTITDLITGCDTTICENCIPDTTSFCPCPMIYMPVCGCDGVMYSNSCLAICAGVGWTPAVSNGIPGGWLPCTTSSTTCFVEISASGTTIFCEGDSVQLQPTVVDINGTYLWSTGVSSNEIWVTTTGDYVLTYTNDTGCVASDTMYIEVMPEPTLIANTVPDPAIICLGDTLVIELTPGIDNYYWNTGNPLHQDQHMIEVIPNSDFIYVCEVIDSNGCDNKLEIEVIVDSCLTATNSNLLFDINIYPNPTKNILNVKLSNTNEFVSISLISIDGRPLFVYKNITNNLQINSDQISPGIYIIKIEGEEFNYNKKVIFE